eukprot:scaffold2062_cov115-Skeletonema_marinoi.AAC.4
MVFFSLDNMSISLQCCAGRSILYGGRRTKPEKVYLRSIATSCNECDGHQCNNYPHIALSSYMYILQQYTLTTNLPLPLTAAMSIENLCLALQSAHEERLAFCTRQMLHELDWVDESLIGLMRVLDRKPCDSINLQAAKRRY